VPTKDGGAAVSETKVEAARISRHEHQAEHGCTVLYCATAKARYQLYLAAIREQPGDSPEGGAAGEQSQG
jgi:hypothetical protein